MRYLWFVLLTFSVEASIWKAGEENFDLVNDKNEDWVSKSCLDTCEIDIAANKFLASENLIANDLAGGKNPGSILCKKIEGQVIYLEKEGETLAVCRIGSQVVSLSRLTRLSLK